jgi:PKD repeat protein
LVILLLLTTAAPLSITTAGPVVKYRPDSAPLTTKPTGQGPYKVGYTFENMTFSTKSYTNQIDIIYPALTAGNNATADVSKGPYPTVLWLPGTCCGWETYTGIFDGMASWGIVVVALDLDTLDYQHSGNITDINELLDHLEAINVTPTARLYKMIDKEAFGLSGHSSGAGLALWDGAYIDRIKALEPLSAAISNSTVDYLATGWHKPVLCQVGSRDEVYINGCRRVFDSFPTPKSEVELIGGDHFGPYQEHLLVAFYLYYLDGRTDYWTYLYGEEAINDTLAGTYDLKLRTSDTHFFPPVVHAAVSKGTAPMDQQVSFSGDIKGYFLPKYPSAGFSWDFEGDGTADHQDPTNANVTHAFTEPGDYTPMLRYKFGRIVVNSVETLFIKVTDPAPVAKAGPDMTLKEDEVGQFDASGSYDTLSDNGTLMFNWTFGDGIVTDFSSSPGATHSYVKAGTYNVKLDVLDRHGVVGRSGLKVTVKNVPPQVYAGKDVTILEDQGVVLTGNATDTPSDMPGLKCRWDFGDGEGTEWSTELVSSHSYVKQDNYTATFFVKDDDSLIVNDSLVVHVLNVAPMVQVVMPVDRGQFQMDQAVEFIGWGSDTRSDFPALRFRWDFGDGNLSEWSGNARTNHTYAGVGTYNTSLEVRDDEGASANISREITVVDVRPSAVIVSPTTEMYINEDDNIDFEGKGTDTPSDQSRLRLQWDIEGHSYDGARISHRFTKAGTYDAVLKVTDPFGKTATASVAVHVYNVAPSVKAVVGPLVVVIGQKVNFSAIVDDTPTDRSLLKTTWDFGDSTNFTAIAGTHAYCAVGTYKMSVTVMDDNGEKATETYTITVLRQGGPEPPAKTNEGRSALGVEIGLLALFIVAMALMMTGLFKRDAPARPTPKVGKRTKKGSKTRKKGKDFRSTGR